MEINVDLEKVEEFISNELATILLENTTFENAVFCLQAAVNLLEEAKASTTEEDN